MSERLSQEDIDEIAACGNGAVLEDTVDGDEIASMALEIKERRAADLTTDERSELRRVRAIVRRLHHREPDGWGESLAGCIAALDKAIRSASPK